jgi:ATP-dependent DNA helicase RecG
MSDIIQKDINFVLNAGEGLKIEFKENLSQIDRAMVAFKDKEGVEALDRKDLSGNYLDVVAEAEKFVLWNIRTGFKIKGFRREELPEYPIEAVREGFVNALMHRDYFEKGANVLLKIFPHEIVIDNPGGLVKGMTRKDLGRKSVSRNPLIADLFYRVGLAEKMGSGIRRMQDLMRKHGLKPPKLEATEKFFTIIFRGPVRKEIIIPAIEGLNERQKKGVEYAGEKGSISSREYMRLNNLGKVYAVKELKELVNKGLLEAIGKGPSTRYLLKK